MKPAPEARPVRRAPRWRRVAVRSVLVLGALVVGLTAAAVLSVRSPAIRQALLEYARSSVEESAGVRATAADFDLGLRRGELGIRDLELSVPGDRPFLSVSKITAVVSWASLFSERIVVRDLRIEQFRLDLEAPLPEAPDEPSAEATDAPAVDVERFEVVAGEVAGGEAPADLEVWLDAFRAGGVGAVGSYLSDRLELDLTVASLVAESTRRPPVEASLSASLTGTVDGSAELTALELAGDGLRLAARGTGELERRAGDLSFELDAQPSRLFPDLTTGGSLEAAGDLTLEGDRLRAAARIDAREIPGELFAPLLAADGSGSLDLARTVVDVDAEIETEAAVTDSGETLLDRLAGHAGVDWRRGDERLVRASVRSPNDSSAPGVGLAFTAEILPAEPGLRRFEGSLSAASWAKLGDGRLEPTKIRLELPNLAATAEQLGISEEPDGFRPVGALQVRGTASGPMRSPDLRLDAAWSLDRETVAEIHARTLEGLALEHPFHLAFEAELLTASAGRRRLAGELLADDTRRLAAGDLTGADLRDGSLELDLPDLTAAAGDLRRLWRRLFPGRDLPELLAPEGAGALWTGALIATAHAAGALASPAMELDAAWRPAAGESVLVTGRGEVSAETPFFDGEARLVVDSLDLARFGGEAGDPEDASELSGEITAALDFAGTPGSHRATLELDGLDLGTGSDLAVSSLRLRAESDGTVVEIASLGGQLSTGQPFSGHGSLRLAIDPSGLPAGQPIRDGDIELELARPIETLERVVASVAIAGTDLEAQIALQEVGAELHPVALVRAPLMALFGASEPEAGALPAADPGQIWLGLSTLELEPFIGLLELDEDMPRPRATFDGSFNLDLADLGASLGTVEISDLALQGEKQNLEAVAPLRLELAGRRLELQPSRLLASGAGGGALEMSARVDLAPEWTVEDGLGTLVSDLAVELSGSFETSALDPVLAGGRASGEAAVELTISGPPDAPVAEGRIDGSRATLFYASPYGTRIEAPVVELSAVRGGTVLESFRARLNGGKVSVQGSADREAGLALQATFQHVRYRVDHGLTITAAGDLALTRPRKGRYLLAGEVAIERGSLRRDLVVDREVLSLLLAPDLTSTDEASLLAEVDLDLSVTTAEGVRIKNNLADLKADWNRLRVRGTLQNPLLAGRIEVVPGGRITGYGQTVRIDEASLAFSGDPSVSPRLELETTSSLEDPTLRDNGRGLSQSSLGDGGPGAGGYWDRQGGDEVSASDEIGEGLLNHYSDRVAGSLGRGLGTELSLEPLPIFGETDTQARLTATQRLSANADLVYSVNPRDAEGQTYILDLHGYDFAPGIRSQLFTNDDNNEGATLVQILELGGGTRGADGPRLRRLAIEAPDGISRRRLAKAIGLRKGDSLPEGAVFDAEVDALEELRRQGHPGARVSVSVEPAGRKVMLGLRVEPGPRADFEFAGEVPPRRDRRSIVQSYRVADEAVSLEEMRLATIQALRGAGYPEPRVEVTAGAGEGDSRTVRIHAEGGRRLDPEAPEFAGVTPEESAALAAQFESRLARVELASAAEGADRYLLQLLKALGYPQAEITGRELDEDGERLVVQIEAGDRQHIRDIEIAGLPPAEAARIEASLPVAAGDPARSDLVTLAAHAIEDDLRARGHAEAEVHTTLEPADADAAAGELILRFAVEPGPEYRVAEVRFDGLGRTRTSFVKRVADLEEGGVFREQDLGAARARLSRTGMFESIRTKFGSDGPMAGDATGAAAAIETPVVFELEQQPRYMVAYGGRWESGEDVGLVADVIDRNFLGRGTTLGLRAIYSGPEERSLRLYHAAPRVLGTHAGLEVFVEGKNEKVEVIVEGQPEDIPASSVLGWAQITSPLGPRTKNRFYLRYQDIFFRSVIFEDSSSASGIEGDPNAGERVVIPSVGWQLSFDTRTGRRGSGASGTSRPDGLFFGLDLVGSHQDLGSDLSVLGVFTQLKLFRTLAELGGGRASGTSGRLTWAQSLRLGLQEPFEDTRIPVVNQLRAGGEYSVRGYRTDTLGPLDESGTSQGGEVFFILNEELRFPVWRDLFSGLLFFDAGNVWASRDAIDSELFTAVGLGLRADTPAGRLRLDVAMPLDRRRDIDDAVKVYIGFGHVF